MRGKRNRLKAAFLWNSNAELAALRAGTKTRGLKRKTGEPTRKLPPSSGGSGLTSLASGTLFHF